MDDIIYSTKIYPEHVINVQNIALQAQISDNIINPNNLSIAIHTGSFHCADALAVAMLRTLPEFSHSRIIYIIK